MTLYRNRIRLFLSQGRYQDAELVRREKYGRLKINPFVLAECIAEENGRLRDALAFYADAFERQERQNKGLVRHYNRVIANLKAKQSPPTPGR
jgi:hypothetical protein